MLSPPSPTLLNRLAPLSTVSGRDDIFAHQAPDLYGLWAAWEDECGERCPPPFWAVAWPAARVLAGFLRAHPEIVREKRVLDLGCGGAVAAIAAVAAGAAAGIANDVDRAALHVAGLNAEANRVRLELVADDLAAGGLPTRAAVVLVADMFYEAGPSGEMLGWLRAAVRGGARVLLADGGRPFSPTAHHLTLLHHEVVPVSAEVEGVRERAVRVFELSD